MDLIEKNKVYFEEIGDLKTEYDLEPDPNPDNDNYGYKYNFEKLLGYDLEVIHQTLLIMLAPNTEKAVKLKMDLIHGRIAWD